MKISKKIALILFLSFLLISSNAHAVVKLDFFEPIADFAQKIEKVKNKIEEKYTATIQKLNEKVRKAIGAEGAALFQMVLQKGKYIIHQAITGQLSMDDLSLGHMLGAIKSQLGDFKLDLANLMALREDYLRSVHAERAAKNADMQKELAKLLAQRDALNNVLAQNTTEAQYKKYQDLTVKEQELQKNIAELKAIRKSHKKQRKKAETENQKMRGYITTIRTTLGENITENDEADIARYEQAIQINEQTINRIDGITDEYDSLVAELASVQAARGSLVEALQSAVGPEIMEKLEETNKAIASLQGQIVKNSAAEIKQSAYESQISAISGQLNDMMAQFSADSLIGSLDAQADAFFNNLEFGDDNESMYTEGIQSLFLGADETLNPTTAARINKNRNKEFYDAYKNLIETVLKSYQTTAQASEASEGCLDSSTQQADGIFGAMTMRVCTDIQSAKMALQYADLLLAQMWFEAAADLQGWNDRYQMSDYDHDVTELDLDAYVMGNNKFSTKNLLKQAKAKAKEVANSAAEKARESIETQLESSINEL